MNARPMDQHESDCVLLARAVADGRYAEDPGHWAPHLAGCEACRACAEGFVLLRGSIEKARGDEPEREAPMPDAGQAVAVALVRFRSRQRKRRALVGVGAALVLGVGTWVVLGRGPEPASPFSAEVQAAVVEAGFDEPLATAMRLHWSIYPRGGGLGQARLLNENPPLRAEFEKALSHPTSLVRRTAMSGLTAAGIPTDPGRLAEVLGTWNEDAGHWRELATAGAGGTGLVAQLERSWAETLKAGLSAARRNARADGKFLPVGVLEPHLEHPDADVVMATLDVLGADPAYVPGARVKTLFESRRTPQKVRAQAIRCWLERLGPGGAKVICDLLQGPESTPELEEEVSTHVLAWGKATDWVRARVRDPSTPLRAALAHAVGLAGPGERLEVGAIVREGLASAEVAVFHRAIELCRRLDLRSHREGIQRRYLSEHAAWAERGLGTEPRSVRRTLLFWDEATGDERHLAWGLEICEHGPELDPWARAWLGRVAAGSNRVAAEGAKRILAR